jgi:hypothetical protein
MPANFRRIALQRAARLLDLAVVSLTLVVAGGYILQLFYLADSGRILGPPDQSRKYSYFWRLPRFLLSYFIELRTLQVASAIPMDSAGTRDLLGDKPYNGSTLSIATPNAIRNKRVSIPFLAFQLHGSLTGTRGRLSTLLLRPITWKKLP